MKKLSILFAALLVLMLAGCSKKAEEAAAPAEEKAAPAPAPKTTVAMVTDVGGVNDQSFNQSAWEGLQKAEKELGIKVSYKESKQNADYLPQYGKRSGR